MTAMLEAPLPVTDRWSRYQEIVSWVDMCMLMTRTLDGRFASRPMSTLEYAGQETIWLATDSTSRKATEIRVDPLVNLAFYNDETREWLSVCGQAELVYDAERIARLHTPLWKLWLPTLDANRDGSATDPRLTLIAVHIERVHYFKRAAGAVRCWTQITGNFTDETPSSIRGTGADQAFGTMS